MYGVLLAEDEMLVRLGLKSSIDWNKYGMYIVADVADGLSAWNVYQRERPDIVITDIRMPELDGMELIQRIRGVSPDTKIVILTCLEDFRLVQKAISLGVSNYFLKLSMTQADLDATFGKLKEELDRSRPGVHMPGRPIANEVTTEQLLKGFLLYQAYSPAEFRTAAEEQGLPLRDDGLQVCVMEIDRFLESSADPRDGNGDIVIASVRNVLSEILCGVGNGVAIHENAGRYVLVMNADGQEAAAQLLQTLTQKIQGMLRMYFNSTATFGASGIGQGYACLHRLLEEALQALGQKYFLGTGALYFPDPPLVRQAFRRWMDQLGTACNIGVLLDSAKVQEFERSVQAFACGQQTAPAVREFLAQRIQWLSSQMDFLQALDISGASLSAMGAVEQAGSLQEAIEAFQKFCAGLADAVAARSRYSDEIRAALLYIHRNYKHDINLNQVAQNVNLSAGYLSNLFKKEVGDNFVSYLNHIRIEKAKKLLADSNLKAYDIASQVGFTDSAYFCKVFKKAAGCSPVQYREHWRDAKKGMPDELETKADTL